MKVLVIAAAFGLTASAAMADCAGHKPVAAATEVDRTITTASVRVNTQSQPSEEAMLIAPAGSTDDSQATTTKN